MDGPVTDLRSYDHWRETFNRELGVIVVDDEGRRRCARDRGLNERLTREDAEGYYLLNTLVRPAACKRLR